MLFSKNTRNDVAVHDTADAPALPAIDLSAPSTVSRATFGAG